MTMTTDALKLAIETMEIGANSFGDNNIYVKPIKACKLALAQEESVEPIARIYKNTSGQIGVRTLNGVTFDMSKYIDYEIYLSPPKQECELDINKMISNFLSWKLPSDFSPDGGIRFHISHPYTSLHYPTGTNLFHAGQAKEMIEAMLKDAVKPKREWIGLSDEQIYEMLSSTYGEVNANLKYGRLVEHKLKELNHEKNNN